MSETNPSDRFDATALVVPFELLRNSDVEVVGGKNASLGEMISQLPEGVRVPTGFCYHGPCLSRVSRPRWPDAEDQRTFGRLGCRGRSRTGSSWR